MGIFGFAGWSGSGKTTLIERLIGHFVAQGLTVSLVKHAHHAFDIDRAGKDSYRHREAGCREVLVTSAARWALIHELRGAPELPVEAALERLAPCDLALVEGFKTAPIPKLEVYRESVGKPLLHPNDPHILALATDASLNPALNTSLPVFDLGDIEAIAAFIRGHARPLPATLR